MCIYRHDATNWFCGDRAGRFLPAVMICNIHLEEYTVAEAFQDAGYTTFFAGKWHYDGIFPGVKTTVLPRGGYDYHSFPFEIPHAEGIEIHASNK